MNSGPLTGASVNLCLSYWGETLRSRQPDATKLTTRALNDLQAAQLKQEGWTQARAGAFVKAMPREDLDSIQVMYPRHAPGDGVRQIDDPHPGAFVYLQVEACLARFGASAANPHLAWAIRRFVQNRPDSTNEDRRLAREVRNSLAEMIDSGDQVSRKAFSQWIELERRLRIREADAARARAYRQRRTTSVKHPAIPSITPKPSRSLEPKTAPDHLLQ